MPSKPMWSAYPVFPTLLTSLDPGLEAVIVDDEPTRLSIQSISRLQARIRSPHPTHHIASLLWYPTPSFVSSTHRQLPTYSTSGQTSRLLGSVQATRLRLVAVPESIHQHNSIASAQVLASPIPASWRSVIVIFVNPANDYIS